MVIPLVSKVGSQILGSLSNHDDDGNKNPTNLHVWQWKTVFFARFARAFFIFWHFEDVVVLSTTWNDLFCSCVDDASIWWHIFNFVLLTQKRWFQFNSRIVRAHFASAMTLNNCDIIEETRSYISLPSTSSLLKLSIIPIGRQSDKSVTLINQTASSQIGHLFSRKLVSNKLIKVKIAT